MRPGYNTILFQTQPKAFASDMSIDMALCNLLKADMVAERLNVDTGEWSGWYMLDPDFASLGEAVGVGRILAVAPGFTHIMLQDANGKVMPIDPYPFRPGLGAIIDRPPPDIKS